MFIWANDSILVNVSHITSVVLRAPQEGMHKKCYIDAMMVDGRSYTIYRGDLEQCRDFLKKFAEEYGNA